MQRIGYAEDIHKLVNNRKLVLGGINIKFDKGLLGHSDADVVLHAIGESILGALALGDLGKYFPDNDKATLNMDSSEIVIAIVKMMKEKHYHVSNIDVSIICEQPKLAPFIEEMRKKVASLLECKADFVSIKAGTNEGLGDIGKGNAIKAIAVVLLEDSK